MWFAHRLVPGEQHDDSREDKRDTALTGGADAGESEGLLPIAREPKPYCTVLTGSASNSPSHNGKCSWRGGGYLLRSFFPRGDMACGEKE